MSLTGKGFFIWKIRDCEGGSPSGIASAALSAGLSHVLIKIADGMNHYNVDSTTGTDYVPAVVAALHAAGIQAWGWHYVYGGDPDGEAWNGGRRAKELGLDGYVIDAEMEYKAAGMDSAARRYVSDLRGYLGTIPVALCSFRFPSYHMEFPWSDFLNKSDFNMPQVYWEQAHNAGAQLQRSFREFQSVSPYRPYLATGAAYSNKGWASTTTDINDFLTTAVALNIPAVNFFSWDYCRKYLPELWSAIAAFPYPTNQPVGIVQKLINALNSHDAETASQLYTESAVHITAEQTIQGRSSIRDWYTNFFTNKQPGVSFVLTAITGKEPTRNFAWRSAVSSITRTGTDTLGLIDGAIGYHYSSFC
jgi:hypothetical protein